jgi:hypothetical protein
VAEQFVDEHVLGELGTVHRYQLAAAARGFAVQQLRGHFLAGAGLAVDQHGGVGAGHQAEVVEHAGEGRAAADHLLLVENQFLLAADGVHALTHVHQSAAVVVDRAAVDGDVFRGVVAVEVAVDDLHRLAGAEHLLQRAFLAVYVAGVRALVRHLVAFHADDFMRREVRVGLGVLAVAGDDGEILVDQGERFGVRVDQALDQFFVHAGRVLQLVAVVQPRKADPGAGGGESGSGWLMAMHVTSFGAQMACGREWAGSSPSK